MTEHDIPQQLTLLPSSDVPLRFRLDAETRRRGIRHIAEIRKHLAERQAAKPTDDRSPLRASSHTRPDTRPDSLHRPGRSTAA